MSKVATEKQFRDILFRACAVVENHIFIYKSGFHGTAYINKEALAPLGVSVVNSCLRGMTEHAIDSGFCLSKYANKTIGVIGPAYGAISYPPVVAEYLEEQFPEVIFMTARTQLDTEGDHYIPDKLMSAYKKVDAWIIVEDIVNQGKTIIEVGDLIRSHFKKEVIASFALVDRGGKKASDLQVQEFLPFIHVDMKAIDPQKDASLLNSGLSIHTTLGKGKLWIDTFGYPPYAPDTDFSTFSLLK